MTGDRPSDGAGSRSGSDRSPDRATGVGDATGRNRRARLSRRAFVLASGAAVGSTVIGAGAADSDPPERLAVDATAPYRQAVSAGLGSADVGDEQFTVRTASGADPFAGVRTGEADLLVSGRPTAPGDVEGLATVGTLEAGRAVLDPPDGEWLEPLSRRTIADRWRDDRPVETWSEVDPQVAAGRTAIDRSTAEPSATALVRGSRSFQYSQGFGGVGYYAVPAAAIRPTRAETVGTASLLRIGYVHAVPDGGTGEHAALDALLSDPVAGGRDYHVDPAVATG